MEPAEMFQSPGSSGCLLVPVAPLPRGQQETAAMGIGNADPFAPPAAHTSGLSAAAWLLHFPVFQFPVGNEIPPLLPARSGCEGTWRGLCCDKATELGALGWTRGDTSALGKGFQVSWDAPGWG